MSKKVSNNDYIFLCSNLRARETRLLSHEKMMKMAETDSFDAAVRFLEDCDYPDLTGLGHDDLERAIAGHRKQIVSEVARFCPEPLMLDAFRLRYDYHNIKVLVKSNGAHGYTERLMSSCGLVDSERMSECYQTENYDMLPEDIRDALRTARDILQKTGDPRRADISVDKAYYSQMLKMTSRLSDDFYYRYVRLSIDAANLRTAVRAVRMKCGKNIIESAILPGGNVAAYSIVDAACGERDLALLFYAGYLQKAGELGAAAMEGGEITAFESECDNTLTRFLHEAKYISCGPAPVLAFLHSLDYEIISVRMILNAKRSGLNTEILKERLREAYV